jgi:Bacteriophage head to tail connecting protein
MTWEAHWQECYDFALPQRDGAVRPGPGGEKKTERLFDATAPDAVDQLAASLMAQLTPPWSSWFGFVPGPDADPGLRQLMAPDLERMSRVVQANFDRSNFVVEMHQCYLDLVTAGTACLMFEEAAPGEDSAFRFTAVPMSQVVLEEGPSGRLDTTFRRSRLTVAHVLERFPQAIGADRLAETAQQNRDATVPVVEAVVPDGHEYAYLAVAENETAGGGFIVLSEGRFATSGTREGP